jgi:hypothetical protein
MLNPPFNFGEILPLLPKSENSGEKIPENPGENNSGEKISGELNSENSSEEFSTAPIYAPSSREIDYKGRAYPVYEYKEGGGEREAAAGWWETRRDRGWDFWAGKYYW